ncbi:MAG: IclR family transcriptional regulator [Inquilinus limosus]|uniref:IclR family transcriptional regulator n=1 Tax=Inquilinus limosus TaxID=171674 RepID=A0A952FKX3_9PROT|nr:IclR family transcriptional regulator [Inquilinus limosus]
MAEAAAAKAERVSERSRVSGIERAVQICDHLLAAGRPLTAYDVSKALGAPMSTIYGVVDSLLRQDLLSRDGDGLLWFGPRLYHYGLAYGRSLNLLETASQEMRELSRLLGETVQICGRDDGHMVVLAMAEPAGHFRVSSKIGTRVPLNWTASGRLLIGHLPWAERVDLMRRAAQPSPTGMAETDPDTLCRIAEAALTEKLAIQLSESDFAVACIAAPICTSNGECDATISVVLPEQKARERERTYSVAVQEAASRIERLLGWTA